MISNIQNSDESSVTSDRPIFQKTDQSLQEIPGFSGDNAHTPCPSCYCTRINLVKMPSHSPLFGARRCSGCDMFLCWEPRPENKQIQQQRQATIAALLKFPQLSQWERTFLEGLKGKKISPRQREVLEKIEARVGGTR